ncbi:hypothetical protein K470DRAFT_271101 [Piedraia hortae CBS 480.64]|uniref:Fucose-specific lectin n=1 Tax=Piedraia hortae CBS 480.64 TaxID=1314780 RepID=A0A6A7BY25_9PEZI|nr:hypothetical protein K470DRAFT_271101 [Piedraia hortae CBS 480.64]
MGGSGIGFASMPFGGIMKNSSQTLANIYYQADNNIDIQVRQLLSNGSWTYKKLPVQYDARLRTPLDAVATVDNNGIVTWNTFMVNYANRPYHHVYQDGGESGWGIIIDVAGYDTLKPPGVYTEGSTPIRACTFHYGEKMSDQSRYNTDGIMVWYASNETLFEEWTYKNYTWEHSKQWSVPSVQAGVGCYSDPADSLAHVMFISSKSAFEFWSIDKNADKPKWRKCPFNALMSAGERFLHNDGEVFYLVDGQNRVLAREVKDAWVCEKEKVVGEPVVIGTALTGTRLGAASVRDGGNGNGMDKGPVVLFQGADGSMLGFERGNGTWDGGVDVLEC